jgi:Domain of unknown function (DUF4440)
MMSTTSVTSDQAALTDLNKKIGEAENRGDRDWLAGILAPRLAFQRADDQKTVDDQVAFLQKVKAGGNRATRIVEPIEVYGDRAIAQCIVKVDDQKFHNLRLFVRRDGSWKLLAWANEPS